MELMNDEPVIPAELEATHHAEEMAAWIPPIMVDGPDGDGDDDEDDIPILTTKKKTSTRSPFVGEKFVVLYSDMGQEQICAVTVESKLRSTWAKWAEYCRSTSFPGEPWIPKYGLQLYAKRDDINNEKDYDHERVDGFTKWLSDNGHGKCVIKSAKTFLNTHIKCEHFSRLHEKGVYASLVSIKVGDSIAVQNSVKAINRRAGKEAMEKCFDIQSDLDQLLAPAKVREILLSVFSPKPEGLVSRLDPINALIFCCMYTGLSQTARRGEELYCQKLIQRTTTTLSEIGPFCGTHASVIVTNKAKHNQEGWLEYTTMLPHMDPIRDAAAWHGFLLVWRLQISHEVFPQFTGNPDYKAIFEVPTYPAARDPKKPILGSKCGEVFSSFFGDCDAVCAKLVHQPRLQAIQEMDRAGIHESEWTRMSGHKGKEAKVHTRSYAHNPPSTCLVQRAGGNFHDLRSFNPVHFIPTPQEQQWLDEIVLELISSIVEQYKEVCKEYHSTKSHQERKKKRLTTLKGTLGSAINDVEHFIMMMACPLVDPVTFLLDINNTQSLWQRYHNDLFATLLNHRAFQFESFGNLQQSILAKVKEQHDFSSSISNESRCAMERYIKDNVAGPIIQQQRENRMVMTHLRQQQEIYNSNQERLIGILLKQDPEAPPTVTPDKAPLVAMNNSPGEIYEGSQWAEGPSTLRDGHTPRKRKAGVTQMAAISREYKRREVQESTVTEHLVLLCDKGLLTLEDYWAAYKTKWKPLEERTEGEWRKDIGFDADGKKRRGRSSWWTQRVGMFKVIEHYIESGVSETQAIEQASAIFNSARTNPARKPCIKVLNVKFKAEMDRLGIKANGRPKKVTTRRNRRKVKEYLGNFEDAFPLNASQQLYLEQVELECADREWQAERQREELLCAREYENTTARWDYAHRNQQGPYPVAPVNYGTVHPLPYHPARHQFDRRTLPPLPDGHEYATVPN